MNKKVQAIVLPIICLLLGTALAVVYNITAPIIADVEKQTATQARQEVLSEADDFTLVEASFAEDLGIVDVYKANNGSGMTVNLITSGYGGEISLMVGIKSDGTIAGVKILTHSETPGLGAKTALPDFLDKYKGKSGTLTVVKNSATSDQDIVAVSSATTSSKAVTKAVNNALTAFDQVKGEL